LLPRQFRLTLEARRTRCSVEQRMASFRRESSSQRVASSSAPLDVDVGNSVIGKRRVNDSTVLLVAVCLGSFAAIAPPGD
jgi:hypothetical protein